MSRRRPPKPPETPRAEPIPATAPAVVIVGGWKDNRPQAEWRPEDGLLPTAVGKGGKPLRQRQCCKWVKGRSRRCTGRAVAQRDCCRMHGGAPGSGRPPVHGRYSHVLGSIRDVYNRHEEAENASDPTGELALMRTAVERLAARAVEGDSPTFRVAALEAFEEASEAAKSGDAARTSAAFGKLGEVLRAGRNVDIALAEVFDLADRTAARATDFRRARSSEMRVWTEAHIIVLLRLIAETVREHAPIDIAVSIQSALDRRLAVAQGYAPAARG